MNVAIAAQNELICASDSTPLLQGNSLNIIDVADRDASSFQENTNSQSSELHRGLNSLRTFAFSFTVVAVVSSISALFPTALLTGGPAVVIWSWIGASFLTIIAGLSMAEIASMYPQGSVYHWVLIN